jgi:hypothetical protein
MVDIQWLFDVQVPAQCDRHADRVREIGSTYQLHITGRDGGEWFFNFDADPPFIRPGVAEEEPACTLILASEDFKALHADPYMNAMSLYVRGKIKALGDPSLYHRFTRLFTLPIVR